MWIYKNWNTRSSPVMHNPSRGYSRNSWKILKKNLIARGRADTTSTTPNKINVTEIVFLTLIRGTLQIDRSERNNRLYEELCKVDKDYCAS